MRFHPWPSDVWSSRGVFPYRNWILPSLPPGHNASGPTERVAAVRPLVASFRVAERIGLKQAKISFDTALRFSSRTQPRRRVGTIGKVDLTPPSVKICELLKSASPRIFRRPLPDRNSVRKIAVGQRTALQLVRDQCGGKVRSFYWGPRCRRWIYPSLQVPPAEPSKAQRI
jgi:hypothetical protein